FIEPVLPLVIGFVLIGAWILGRRLTNDGRWGVALACAMGAILAFGALSTDGHMVADALACDRNRVDCATPASLDYVDAAVYAATHTSPESRFIVPKNATLYYYAPRKSAFWDEVI